MNEAWLRLTVTKAGAGVARARFDGKLRMKHSFYLGKDHEDDVEATPDRLHRFRFCRTADPADALGHRQRNLYRCEFGAVLNSVSAETLEAQLDR